MRAPVQIWCDRCKSRVHVPELVQWSSCRANGWRTLDFCSYRCADAFRLEATDGRAL